MAVHNRSTPSNSNYGVIHFDIPEMSMFEKKVRRLEMVMLENSNGFFKSALKQFVGTYERLEEALALIGAVEFGGFWVHPHYYHNVRHGHATYLVSQHSVLTEETADKVAALLIANPEIKVYELLRITKIVNPKELIIILQYLAESVKDKRNQFAAACYLYRHFDIRAVVFS